MFACYFCTERPRVGYWSHYCEDCANLRRMLLIYSPGKCCNILKRTLTRDEKQITYKIQQEVKNIVNKDIEKNVTFEDEKTDESYIEKPSTRSSSKKK